MGMDMHGSWQCMCAQGATRGADHSRVLSQNNAGLQLAGVAPGAAPAWIWLQLSSAASLGEAYMRSSFRQKVGAERRVAQVSASLRWAGNKEGRGAAAGAFVCMCVQTGQRAGAQVKTTCQESSMWFSGQV